MFTRKTLRFAAFCAVLSSTSTAVLAEELIVAYYTTLTAQDTFNSKGAPLNSVCAIVQQDRANVHRFGNPDNEQPDTFFTTSERRAMMTGKCVYDPNHHSVSRTRNRVIGFVLVRVYGNGENVSRVQIMEAAGYQFTRSNQVTPVFEPE